MTTNEITIKMVLDRWHALIDQCDGVLNALSDEQLQREIATGKNRGIYLLGHLIAVHDDMMRLLNFGDKQYPGLFEPFLKQPDRAVHELPSIQELRTMWSKQKEDLGLKINAVSTDEWFQGHSAVSAEDFAKEPHRNKLNIIITRTNHLSYHLGQIVLLKEGLKPEKDL